MIAGPNGSGKSTLAEWSEDSGFTLGVDGAALPQWFLKYVYDPFKKVEMK